jgi:hypothetical protein
MVPFEAFSSAVSLIDNSTGMNETSCNGICTRKSSLHLSASYRRSSSSQVPVGEDLMLSLSLSMQTAAWLTTVGGRRRRKRWKAGRARVACATRMGVNCCQGSQRGVAAPATLFRTSPPWTRRRPKLWALPVAQRMRREPGARTTRTCLACKYSIVPMHPIPPPLLSNHSIPSVYHPTRPETTIFVPIDSICKADNLFQH